MPLQFVGNLLGLQQSSELLDLSPQLHHLFFAHFALCCSLLLAEYPGRQSFVVRRRV